MSNTHVWSGLGEQDELPVRVEVYHDDLYGFAVWENGELRDDLDPTIEEITGAYKHHFWEDVNDFKHGIYVDVEQILRRYEGVVNA